MMMEHQIKDYNSEKAKKKTVSRTIQFTSGSFKFCTDSKDI